MSFPLQTANEADKRCKRLDGMCDDLEDFYEQLQELDRWLDTAIEKSEDLKISRDTIDIQYTNFKVSYHILRDISLFVVGELSLYPKWSCRVYIQESISLTVGPFVGLYICLSCKWLNGSINTDETWHSCSIHPENVHVRRWFRTELFQGR